MRELPLWMLDSVGCRAMLRRGASDSDAFAVVPASAPLLVAEQLSNLLLRFAASEAQDAEANTHLDEALSWLDSLDCRLSRTNERGPSVVPCTNDGPCGILPAYGSI
jgi:hypothetical protein